jgi:hypothetical protein
MADASARGPRLAAACAAAAALALAASDSRAAPRFEQLELSPHDRVLGATARDLDGDTRPELVVASAERLGQNAWQRHLTVYRLRVEEGAPEAPLRAEVWRELSVPDDAAAYALGDLLGSGQAQILYLTPTALFALDLETQAARKLTGEHRLLATLAAPQSLPFWDGLQDLDRDGRLDVILPDATGYAVYRSDGKGGLSRTGRIETGSAYASEPLSRRRRRVREAQLLNFRAVNQVAVADVNADQRPDLIAMDEDHVLAFAQAPGLRFASTPTFRRPLVGPGSDPFGDPADVEIPDIQFGDLDGDGRADFVVPEVDVGELVTRLRVFLSAEDGPPERPSQILKLSSLGNQPELTDINGDGRLDLGCTTVRTDRVRALAQPGAQRLDFTYYAFLFRVEERAFSARPDVEWDVSVELSESQERPDDDGTRSGFIRLDRDFTADGIPDLVRMNAQGEIAVHAASVAGSDRMRVRIGDLLLSAQARPTADVRLQDVDGDRRSDVLLFYEESLLLLVPRG